MAGTGSQGYDGGNSDSRTGGSGGSGGGGGAGATGQAGVEVTYEWWCRSNNYYDCRRCHSFLFSWSSFWV